MSTVPLVSELLLTLAQADAPATAAQAAGAANGGRSVLGYIASGGFLSYVLVVVSIVALALIVANLIILRFSVLAPVHVVQGLERLLRDGDVGGAVRYCQIPENDSFLARVIGAGLTRCLKSPFGTLELRNALEEAGGRETTALERVTHLIGLLAAIGPMLGLLGTVVGMIGAFNTLGRVDGAARSQELAGYMSIAMVTTAEGLVIAIPCTILYSVFRRRVDALVAQVGDVAETLTLPLMGAAAAPAGVARPAARPAPAAPAANPGLGAAQPAAVRGAVAP